MFNYSKTSGSLWQHYRDEPLLNSNIAIIDFPVNNNDSILVKLKTKKDGKAGNGGTMMLKQSYHKNIQFFFEEPWKCY